MLGPERGQTFVSVFGQELERAFTETFDEQDVLVDPAKDNVAPCNPAFMAEDWDRCRVALWAGWRLSEKWQKTQTLKWDLEWVVGLNAALSRFCLVLPWGSFVYDEAICAGGAGVFRGRGHAEEVEEPRLVSVAGGCRFTFKPKALPPNCAPILYTLTYSRQSFAPSHLPAPASPHSSILRFAKSTYIASPFSNAPPNPHPARPFLLDQDGTPLARRRPP